jgi:uncharacterized protein (TIGR03435 family)
MLPRIFVGVVACAAFAQTPPPLAFEVASIKPAPAGQNRGGTRSTMDSIIFTNANLRYCITFAYHVHDYQITAPGWLQDARFDITAKGPSGTKPKQLPEMLQTLLAQRFQLQVHREIKELPGYELVVGKDGPRLTESEPKPAGPGMSGMHTSMKFPVGGTLAGENVRMDSLAANLSMMLGRPVIDRTALRGEYNISLAFSFEDTRGGSMISFTGAPPPQVEQSESVFQSIQKLGLRLESKKVPTEMIVVDRMERTPTEN